MLEGSLNDSGKEKKKRSGVRFKLEWDLIFWLFASFAMLYFTDFASHILFDPIVKRYSVHLRLAVLLIKFISGGGWWQV